MAGVECPANARCICRPCIPGSPFNAIILPTTLVNTGRNNFSVFIEALATPCQRVQSCITTTQFEPMILIIADVSLSGNLVDRLRFRVGSLEGPLQAFYNHHENTATPDGSVYGAINFTMQGLVTISILYDGEHMPFSPFFVAVEPPPCPADRVSNEAGACICGRDRVSLGYQCLPNKYVIAIFLVSGLLVIAVIAAAAVVCQRRHLDQEWLISPTELKHESQPVTKMAVLQADSSRPTSAIYRHQRVSVLVLRSSQPLRTHLDASTPFTAARRDPKTSNARAFRYILGFLPSRRWF